MAAGRKGCWRLGRHLMIYIYASCDMPCVQALPGGEPTWRSECVAGDRRDVASGVEISPRSHSRSPTSISSQPISSSCTSVVVAASRWGWCGSCSCSCCLECQQPLLQAPEALDGCFELKIREGRSRGPWWRRTGALLSAMKPFRASLGVLPPPMAPSSSRPSP